ncbi:hypothetical protein CerSpe_241850 [Prunus speciosa]
MKPVEPSFLKFLVPTQYEQEGISIDIEVLEDMRSDFRFCLVGKVFFVRSYPHGVFKTLIVKLWDFASGLSIREVADNLYLFHFQREQDLIRVLAMEPWSFK